MASVNELLDRFVQLFNAKYQLVAANVKGEFTKALQLLGFKGNE